MLRAPIALLLLTLGACSPALDWRDAQPTDSGLHVQLPCRPASHARKLPLAGEQVTLTLYACNAADATWAVAWADVADPAHVRPALEELRRSALNNLKTAEPRSTVALAVPGANAHPQMERLLISGRLPDGTQAVAQTAVFARALRVYQATALGPRLTGEHSDTFFASLRLAP